MGGNLSRAESAKTQRFKDESGIREEVCDSRNAIPLTSARPMRPISPMRPRCPINPLIAFNLAFSANTFLPLIPHFCSQILDF